MPTLTVIKIGIYTKSLTGSADRITNFTLSIIFNECFTSIDSLDKKIDLNHPFGFKVLLNPFIVSALAEVTSPLVIFNETKRLKIHL